MLFNNLVLDPVKASKIMKDFEKTQETPSIMKNNFSKKEKFLLFSVCYLRTSGNLLLSKKLTVDLINMLCIMKKYKKGGSPYEIEEYDPPRGSFLFNMKNIVLGGIGAAFCFMGMVNAIDQTKTNFEKLNDQVYSIGDLMDFAQNDWNKRSNLVTDGLVDSFKDAIDHNPGIEKRIHDDDDDKRKTHSKGDQVALPDYDDDHVALAPRDGPTYINLNYLATETYSQTVEKVLGTENTLATCLTIAVVSALGDVIPYSFGPDIKNIEAATTVLQGNLTSAFNSLQESAKHSQPASLMKKITKAQALIMTDVETTGKNWVFSRDTAHLKNSLDQLTDLQGNIITEYGQASLLTFAATKRKTISKIKNIRANIESINNNLWAIKTHLAGFLAMLKLIKSGIRTSDDNSLDFEYYNIAPRREITLSDSRGRSMKKKKPVTHKKPKGKEKGKKSKGKRGKTKGKKSKGKRGKTRRK